MSNGWKKRLRVPPFRKLLLNWSFIFKLKDISRRYSGLLMVVAVVDSLTQPPGDVDLLELVETGQDTGASDTTEDVGTSSLHQ